MSRDIYGFINSCSPQREVTVFWGTRSFLGTRRGREFIVCKWSNLPSGQKSTQQYLIASENLSDFWHKLCIPLLNCFITCLWCIEACSTKPHSDKAKVAKEFYSTSTVSYFAFFFPIIKDSDFEMSVLWKLKPEIFLKLYQNVLSFSMKDNTAQLLR